jgi:superoxide reductase
MDRRKFITGAILSAFVLMSEKALGGQYGHTGNVKLNRPSNKENPPLIEQKHIPAIETPEKVQSGRWFDVHVRVGFMKEHPSTPEHWITMIKLLVNGKETARSIFSKGGVSASAATFRIRLDKTSTLEAVENCNLHGTWISNPEKIQII